MIQWKLGCRSRKQKGKTQPIARPGIGHCHWFIPPLLLATPTMQFSLDRKRRSHKQNQCSASDSVGLIFTGSYRFTLLITTPTTTPSLVKTSLKCASFNFRLNWKRSQMVPVWKFLGKFKKNLGKARFSGNSKYAVLLTTECWSGIFGSRIHKRQNSLSDFSSHYHFTLSTFCKVYVQALTRFHLFFKFCV